MTWTDVATVFALGVAAVDAVAIALLARNEDSVSDTAAGLPLGAPVPQFVGVDTRGNELTEKDAFGRVVLFVGTRCARCPGIARQIREDDSVARANILVVVVNRGEDTSKDELMRDLNDAPGLVVIDDQSRLITERLAAPGLPFAYAIDGNGRVRAKRAVFELEPLRSALRASKAPV